MKVSETESTCQKNTVSNSNLLFEFKPAGYNTLGWVFYVETRSNQPVCQFCSLFFRMPPHRRVNGRLGDQPGVTIPGTTFSHPGQGSMKTTSMHML